MKRVMLGVLALSLAVAGCSSSDGDPSETSADDVIIVAEPTPEAFDASDSTKLAGISTSPSQIQAGECFNEYLYSDRSDFLQQVTTIVGCDGPHDREAYFRTEYPADDGDPAPADETLRRWADKVCLEQFKDFVGLEYVLSKLEIGTIVPSFESWTDQNDRNVICYVFPDEADRRLKSSVKGLGL